MLRVTITCAGQWELSRRTEHDSKRTPGAPHGDMDVKTATDAGRKMKQSSNQIERPTDRRTCTLARSWPNWSERPLLAPRRPAPSLTPAPAPVFRRPVSPAPSPTKLLLVDKYDDC